jgi:hypothetical protein
MLKAVLEGSIRASKPVSTENMPSGRHDAFGVIFLPSRTICSGYIIEITKSNVAFLEGIKSPALSFGVVVSWEMAGKLGVLTTSDCDLNIHFAAFGCIIKLDHAFKCIEGMSTDGVQVITGQARVKV